MLNLCYYMLINVNCYGWKSISWYLPKLDVIESPISNIFDDDCFSKLFCSLNLLYQPALPILVVRIKCDVSIKG